MAVRRRQQVAQRDRPAGGDGVVDRPAHRAHDDRSRQLRQEVAHRVVEPDRAVGDERQGERRRHRLGDRRDPEQRVLRHRPPAHRLVAEHDDLEIVAAADGGDESRHELRVDERAQVIGARGHRGSLAQLPPVGPAARPPPDGPAHLGA